MILLSLHDVLMMCLITCQCMFIYFLYFVILFYLFISFPFLSDTSHPTSAALAQVVRDTARDPEIVQKIAKLDSFSKFVNIL